MSSSPGRRASWLLPVLLLGVGFAACGGKATDTADPGGADGVAGKRTAGQASGGSGGTGSTPVDQVSECGSVGVAGAGEGGSRGPGRPNDLPGEAGAPACNFENECGGCTQEYLSVRCSWGELELPWEVAEKLSGDVPATCRAAQQQYAQTQSGGGADAGGADAGGAAGVGGEGPIRPGACATYRAPGRSITSCEFGCTETADVRKAGQCNIGGECCVVVGSIWCGI